MNVKAENGNKKNATIDRERFECYMKAYNSKLKITDLCIALGSNRTYLSSFINREYGMNFSRYMNCCRLKELDRLRTDPATAGESGMELVLKAGFSSYSSYIRVKKQEDKTKLLKSF